MNVFADFAARPAAEFAGPHHGQATAREAAQWFGQGPGPQQDRRSIVDLLPQALLLVHEDRTVVATNLMARRLIDESAIRLSEGRLIGLGQMCTLQLSRLLVQAATGSALDYAVWFGRSLSTGLLHLSRPASPAGDLPGFATPPAVLLVVQVDQPALAQCARIDALTDRCRLSPTERHVLMLLADGMTVELAARHLSLQLSTLRSHVRNLLGKTQAPSLMQLLRWTGSAQTLLN